MTNEEARRKLQLEHEIEADNRCLKRLERDLCDIRIKIKLMEIRRETMKLEKLTEEIVKEEGVKS